MKNFALIALGFVAFALAACGTLDPNVTLTQGSVIGLGAKANPDGTAEGAIGYLGASAAFVPSVNSAGVPITFAGHCGEQREIATLISVTGNANNSVGTGPNGVSLALNVGTIVATGQPAINISDSLKEGASKLNTANPPSYEDEVCPVEPSTATH